jgi:hypothetical protein
MEPEQEIKQILKRQEGILSPGSCPHEPIF